MAHFNKHIIPHHWEQYWSTHPDGYTILEALLDWLNTSNAVIENVNDMNKQISFFFDTFRDKLTDTTGDVLQEWRDSGFFDVIFAEKVLEHKVDKVQYNEDKTMLDFRIYADTFFTPEELIDYQLAEPKLDHSPSVQRAIDALHELGTRTLIFPRGTYRVKNLVLPFSDWTILGEETGTTYRLNSKIRLIADTANNTVFSGRCQFFTLRYLDFKSEGSKGDGLKTTVFINPSNNGTFINIDTVRITNFSATALQFFDVIDSTVNKLDLYYNTVGLDIAKSAWDRSTTITFSKIYAQYNGLAMRINNVQQSSMIDCIFEYNDKSVEMRTSQLVLTNLYLENNKTKLDATDTRLVESGTFVFGSTDGIDNAQPNVNPYNKGRTRINQRGMVTREVVSEFYRSPNTLLGNNNAPRWVLLGTWLPEVNGSHLTMDIIGTDGWGQSSTLVGSGNVCRTTLTIERGANGNTTIPNVSSYLTHEGTSPAITRVRVEHINEYRSEVKVYALVSTYARASVEVGIREGWFQWSGADEAPSLTNSNMSGEVPHMTRIESKDLFNIVTDNLKIDTSTTAGGELGTTAKQFLTVNVKGTIYKIPLL